MAQYKKDKIKETIDATAMEVFSRKGYQNTKITDISKMSGVSVGNIYRYYKGKDEIFYTLIPQDFYDSLKNKLTEKITCWGDKEHSDRHSLISQEFIDFIIDNRMLFLILLGGCDGTKYKNIKSELVSFMIEIFVSNYGSKLDFDIPVNKSVIELIYEKHIETISSVLNSGLNQEELKKAIKFINKYHINGITSFIHLDSRMEKE